MKRIMIVFAVALAGCAGPFGMTGKPELAKELAKVKDANCAKITGVYMGATVTMTATNVDKGVPVGAGKVTITPDCGIEITAEPKSK
jgi:hypothetical protein